MMGIVDDSSFELELDRLKGTKPPQIIDMNRGRGNQKEVPESLRKIIGENALTEGNKDTKELTRALGISDSSLTAYKKGATSCATYDNPNPELANHTNNVREKILSKARSRTLQAIQNITKDKLESAKARDLAGIAKDLSGVIKNLEPDNPDRDDKKPFVIYAPQFRDERSFEMIVVNE